MTPVWVGSAFVALAVVIVLAITINLRSVRRGEGPDSVALRVNAGAFGLVLLLGVLLGVLGISGMGAWPALIFLAPMLVVAIALLAYAFRGPRKST